MIPPVPVYLHATLAAATQMNNRRAKQLDGDSSSENLVETFNAVTPSVSSQAQNGARQVAARFKPLNARKTHEETEDEEEKFLHLIADRYGIEHLTKFSSEEAAAYLKSVLSLPGNSSDIAQLEKEFGLDLIEVTLSDILDAIIDNTGDAANRVKHAFSTFSQKQQNSIQQVQDSLSENPDVELGIYSPFSK